MERNWTLTADMSARQLMAILSDVLPGQIQPGVTGGRYATVTVRATAKPAWMEQIKRDHPDTYITID